MSNSLRDSLVAKYGSSSAVSVPTKTVSTTTPAPTKSKSTNSLRASLVEKYSAKPTLNVNTPAGTGSNVYNAGPSVTPADTRTNREKVTSKYDTPTPTSSAGVRAAAETKKKTETNIAQNGQMASPEYFATSVDVRSSSGKFLKTFTGTQNGEAKKLAEEYAQKNGGTIQVTPPAGFLGRAFTRAQEAFKGALENFNQKASNFTDQLTSLKPDPNGGPTMVQDPNVTPVSRVASGVDLGVASISVLLSPLSAAFSAAEETPGVPGKAIQGVNYIFGKAGEAGGWVASKAVDALPVSDQTKNDIRPAAENLSSLLAQLALGKLGAKATEVTLKKTEDIRAEIKTKITKDVIVSNQLPRNIYISPDAVKSIFANADKITPEELDMVKSLGLDGKGFRSAVKDGISIEVPAERITSIVDKPWFATVKGIFGVAPETTKVIDVMGKPVQTKTPIISENRLLEAPAIGSKPVKTVLDTALTDPITPTLLERINSLTPEESSAFGKKVVESINQAVGINIDPAKANLPGNIKVIGQKSGDNRPAQFKNGQIEIFLPNLLEDIKNLAEGKQIVAHEGEFATVYKKVDGESIEELSTRYVRDIILHEAAHQKTMTLADQSTIKNFMSEINSAKLAQNDNAVVAARKKLNDFMKTVEDKANAYMRDNKVALENEFLGGKQHETQTAMQRRISEKTNGKIPSRTPSSLTEKQALKQRIGARAKGAREGFSAGKKEGSAVMAEKKKSQFDTALEKIKDRKATIESRRLAAIDYAQILPFRERGKFLKAINGISSEKQFLDVIDRISKSSKAAERKVLISKIAEELKGSIVKKTAGLPNVKFEIEAQRTLNEMRRLQKTMTYQEAQMAIANKIASWQAENPDAAVPVDLLREIDVLKTVGIKDQTVNELSDTLSAIQSLKETGRTKRETEIFNRETDIQRKKDKIYDVITGGKPLPSDKLSVKTRERKGGVIQATKEFLTMHQYGFEEILDVFSINDKTSLPYESFLSRTIGDKVSDSFNKQNRGELKVVDGLSEKVKEIYGLSKNTEVMQMLGNLKEVETIGEFKHNDGVTRTLELSKGEAMQYYMWMQDETLLPTFTETLHWTPEIMDAVKSSLSEKDIKMADTLINEFYPTYYESINAVYAKEYGIDLPFNPNYSPVHRAIDASIPENVLLAQESAKYATARNGSLKERQNSRIDLKATDAFENVMRHVVKMEHYKAWSDTMFELRRIFGDKQVRQAITDIHGSGYMKVMDNFLNDFARDGVSREKVIKIVDTLRQNVAKSLLGLNVNVGIKQLTGILNYGIELPVADMMSGIGSFWTDPLGHSRFLTEKSAMLQERFGDGFERDIKFAIQKGYDKKLAKANNLSEVMFTIIRNADKFTVYQGSWAVYRSKYLEAKKLGKTDAEAEAIGIRAAENITNRVQESSRLDTLSSLQRGGSLAKLFTMLAGQPNKYLRIMNNAGRNYKAGRQKGSVAAKRIIWTWIVVPFIYNLVADQLIDKKYRETSGGLVTRTLLGPLTYPLVVGQLFQQIYGWTQGENFVYQASPVEAFMNDIQKSIQQYGTGDMVDGTTYAIDAIGKLSGVPTTIVTKPIRKANKDAAGSSPGVTF